ncbi:16S rRNA (cytidine(1402)-2'-O)-methyltransferase, partial [bacterium]
MVEYQFYLVSTPIGNLEDFTFRAKNILESVDLVLAEDTRRTGLILARYGIKTRLKAYHDHNKDRVTPQVIEFIESGKKAALVSDAGTPLISDPGYYLVVRLIEHGITVTAVPGPSAVITGLVLSGLPTDRFAFL